MRAMGLACLTAALFLAGCGVVSNLNGGSNGPLVADVRSPITDVPVPAGFTMADESSSQQLPNYRVVNHRYTGYDTVFAVVSFYKEQLPKKSWVLADQKQSSGEEVMVHFTRKGEDCFVTVSKRTFDTSIRIQIDPMKKVTVNGPAGL